MNTTTLDDEQAAFDYVMSRQNQTNPWLFPEIGIEAKEYRVAAAREAAQRVRNEKRVAAKYLSQRDLQWLIDKLVDDGPATDIGLMMSRMDGRDKDRAPILPDLWALWRVGKLWRESQGIHFGSGEEYFLYGIRGVHDHPKK